VIALSSKNAVVIPELTFTIAWGVAGFHVTNLMMSQRNFNGDYFVNKMMQSTIARLFAAGRVWQSKAYITS
jgi:hypothetical protein